MSGRLENPSVRDLMRNPEVVLLLHGERSRRQGRVLRTRGRVTFRSERSVVIPVLVLSALRDYLSPRGGGWNTVRHRRKRAVSLRHTGERANGGGAIAVVLRTAESLRFPS